MPVPGAVPLPVPAPAPPPAGRALPGPPAPRGPALELAANDAELRALLRDALPARCFEPPTLPALRGLGLVLVLALGTWLAATTRTPWARLPLALLLGNAWVALSLFTQELGHAALSRSRRAESAWLLLGGLPFLLGPTLWRAAHRTRHHAHVGCRGRDPELSRARPASGRAAALLALPGQLLQPLLGPQRLLWRAGRGLERAPLERGRAACECLLLAGAWLALARAAGAAWPWAVAAPLFLANAVVAAYASAQHPPATRAGGGPRVLRTTRSLALWTWIDRLHRHAGHHVEHHLFPAMASRHYPAVRAWLLEHEPRRFDCRAPWARRPARRAAAEPAPPIATSCPERAPQSPVRTA